MLSELSISFIIISVILGSIVACTIVGNIFVITAILIDKNLQTTANQLVLSLAVADLMVACLVMPLGAYNDIYQGWYLGKIVCEFWTSADVLCCTASILNLLAIAIDRYWAVTNVDYIYKRTRRRVNLMVLCAWTVGAIVSLAPIFGWKDPDFAHRVLVEHKCLVSQDVAYQIFATISTFYAPLVLLLALYWRIFQVARKRIRQKPGRRPTAPNARPATILAGAVDRTHANRSSKCDSGIGDQSTTNGFGNQQAAHQVQCQRRTAQPSKDLATPLEVPSGRADPPEAAEQTQRGTWRTANRLLGELVSSLMLSRIAMGRRRRRQEDSSQISSPLNSGQLEGPQFAYPLPADVATAAGSGPPLARRRRSCMEETVPATSKSYIGDKGVARNCFATQGADNRGEEEAVGAPRPDECARADNKDNESATLVGGAKNSSSAGTVDTPTVADLEPQQRKGGDDKRCNSPPGGQSRAEIFTAASKRTMVCDCSEQKTTPMRRHRLLRCAISPSELEAGSRNSGAKVASYGERHKVDLPASVIGVEEECYCCCCAGSRRNSATDGEHVECSGGGKKVLKTLNECHECRRQQFKFENFQINHGIDRSQSDSLCSSVAAPSARGLAGAKKTQPMIKDADDEDNFGAISYGGPLTGAAMVAAGGAAAADHDAPPGKLSGTSNLSGCSLVLAASGGRTGGGSSSRYMSASVSSSSSSASSLPSSTISHSCSSIASLCLSSSVGAAGALPAPEQEPATPHCVRKEDDELSLSSSFPPPIRRHVSLGNEQQSQREAHQQSGVPSEQQERRQRQKSTAGRPVSATNWAEWLRSSAIVGNQSANQAQAAVQPGKTPAPPSSGPSRALDIRRKFRALGQLVSFVQTSRNFNSSSSTPSSSTHSVNTGNLPVENNDDKGDRASNSSLRSQAARADHNSSQVKGQPLRSDDSGERPNPSRKMETSGLLKSAPGTSSSGNGAAEVQEGERVGGIFHVNFSCPQGNQPREDRPLTSTVIIFGNQTDKTKIADSAKSQARTSGSQQASALTAKLRQQLNTDNNQGGGVETAPHVKQNGPSLASVSKRRENMDIRREKKAAKTLAIITGVFVCCWLPFFLNAIIMPICGSSCTPSDLILSILLWLGYLNSLLNPIIYTIFSPDFRRAFRRLLCWPGLNHLAESLKVA